MRKKSVCSFVRLFVCSLGILWALDCRLIYAADTTVKGTTADSTAASLEVTNSSDTSLLYVRNDGNVGIGTTSPRQTLEVVGNIITDWNDRYIGTWYYGGNNYRLGLNTVIGTRTTNIHAYSSEPDNEITFSTGTVASPSEKMRITNAGNVGIGTASPNEQLEITGNFRLPATTATTGIIKSGADRYIHNYGAANFFAGVNAGNLSLTGWQNTGIGYGALGNLTTGSYGTAIGYLSLGGGNSSENSAFGRYTLYNATGGYNTGVGNTALLEITTGIYNVGIGKDAGRWIADGATPNQTSTSSIYLGSVSKALANGDTNEIVIGATAIGVGSNSVVLGNDSITKTILKGNVGIGTTAPATALHVVSSTVDGSIATFDNAAPSNQSYYNFKVAGTLRSTLRIDVVGNFIINPRDTGGIYLSFDSGTSGVRFGNGASSTVGIVTSVGNLSMNGTGTFGTNVVINGGGVSYFNGGNVGIGTTAPGAPLTVVGSNITDPSLNAFNGQVIISGVTALNMGSYSSAPNAFWMQNMGATPNGSAYPMSFQPLGGNVGIGTTSPTNGKLVVIGGVTIGADAANNVFNTASGGTGSTTMYIGSSTINVTASDKRMKEDIAPSKINALELLKKMQVVDFNWKKGNKWRERGRATGLIAQDVIKYLPQVVNKPDDPKNMWTVEYQHIVPYLIKAIQEQQKEIEELKREVRDLKGAK